MAPEARNDREVRMRPDIPDNQTFKIVGLGGTGSIFNRYASVFVAGRLNEQGRTGRWVLIDGDAYEHANAARQIFRSPGKNKATAARDEMLEYPFFNEGPLSIIAVEAYVNRDTIGDLIHDGDIVFMNVDNHASRRLVEEYARTLDNLAVFYPGNDGVEQDAAMGKWLTGTHGSVLVHIRRNGCDLCDPCRYHPEIHEAPLQHLPGTPSCVDLFAGAPQILLSNCWAAIMQFSAMYLFFCDNLNWSEAHFDWSRECLARAVDGLKSKTPSEEPCRPTRPI